jgi:glycosyltransferase involved in cell wall biosynthesis
MDDVHRNRWWEAVTRYTLKRSTFFISDANVTCDKAVAYGMNPERTVVFPWGVDLQHYAPSTVQHPSSNFTLFCNRSWEPRYGVDVLAKAFVKVAAARPELGLILLGGGSQGGVLRQILMNSGVIDQVHFGGHVAQKDLPSWYHQADLYISPSHVDGSSVSLMEALACGLPCLVSDIPANKEWVRNDENGWLFRDGDVDDLAAKILQAVKKRGTLAQIGRNSRSVAEARADWKKNAETLMCTYEMLAGK